MGASQKFITSFIDAFQDLSQGKGDAYDLLKEAFPKHERAYLDFRPRMKGRSRRLFDEAWKDYYGPTTETPRHFGTSIPPGEMSSWPKKSAG